MGEETRPNPQTPVIEPPRVPSTGTGSSPSSGNITPKEQALFDAFISYRRSLGLAVDHIRLSPKMLQVARAHVADLQSSRLKGPAVPTRGAPTEPGRHAAMIKCAQTDLACGKNLLRLQTSIPTDSKLPSLGLLAPLARSARSE